MFSLSRLARPLCFANGFIRCRDDIQRLCVTSWAGTGGSGCNCCERIYTKLWALVGRNLAHQTWRTWRGEGFDSYSVLLCGLRVGVTLRTGRRGGVRQGHLGRWNLRSNNLCRWSFCRSRQIFCRGRMQIFWYALGLSGQPFLIVSRGLAIQFLSTAINSSAFLCINQCFSTGHYQFFPLPQAYCFLNSSE